MNQFKFKSGESYLVVGNLQCVQQLVGSVQSSVFLLAHNHRYEDLTGFNTLRPVLIHHLKGGDQLTLLKKRTNVEQLRILELDNKHWLSELSHLSNGSDNEQPVVVVSRKWEPKEILPILANQNYSHRVRHLS
ncbi:hypothetical protein J6590_049725 [Homalodisca vitripennis]|nr:hypothetical protein J6590_049725 [Homalodisca vitripennis]